MIICIDEKDDGTEYPNTQTSHTLKNPRI